MSQYLMKLPEAQVSLIRACQDCDHIAYNATALAAD